MLARSGFACAIVVLGVVFAGRAEAESLRTEDNAVLARFAQRIGLGDTQPREQVSRLGLEWGDQLLSTTEAVRRWLAEHDAPYERWATRHRMAARGLEDADEASGSVPRGATQSPAVVTTRGLVWGDRLVRLPSELAAWLEGHGASYALWADRHPAAAGALVERRSAYGGG